MPQNIDKEGRRILRTLGIGMLGLFCVLVIPAWLAERGDLFEGESPIATLAAEVEEDSDQAAESDTFVIDMGAFVAMEAGIEGSLTFELSESGPDTTYNLVSQSQGEIPPDRSMVTFTFQHEKGFFVADEYERRHDVLHYAINEDGSPGDVLWTISVTWPASAEDCRSSGNSRQGVTSVEIDCDLNAT